MLEIKETTIEDIKCVQQLWADGDVMKFVGFPDGLHETDERMQNWLRWIEQTDFKPLFDFRRREILRRIVLRNRRRASKRRSGYKIVWICTGTWNCNGRALPCNQRTESYEYMIKNMFPERNKE